MSGFQAPGPRRRANVPLWVGIGLVVVGVVLIVVGTEVSRTLGIVAGAIGLAAIVFGPVLRQRR